MINVAIIGLGRSGWELHALPLSKFPEYHLTAVCDQSEKRRADATQTFGIQAYAHWQEIVNLPNIELVVVSTPSHLHVEPALAALAAGKHVVVEKPMATTLADVDRLVAAAKKANRMLTVFHNRHWDRDYQMVKKLVQEKLLGELLTLESRVMTYGPEWATFGVPEYDPRWRTKAAFGGGFLGDWGPHLIEQCLDLTNEFPTSLNCQLRSQLWATEVEDYFNIRLTFPSGLLVTLEGSNNARIPLPRWFLVGRNGTLIADGTWGHWTDMRVRTTLSDVTMDLLPQDIGPSSGNRNMDVAEELSACFYSDLAEALHMGHPPAITMQRAHQVMVILETARKSSQSSQTIQLG
jgi:scyllo-inositol 2-dehydrogenase (NADP+)